MNYREYWESAVRMVEDDGKGDAACPEVMPEAAAALEDFLEAGSLEPQTLNGRLEQLLPSRAEFIQETARFHFLATLMWWFGGPDQLQALINGGGKSETENSPVDAAQAVEAA